MKLSLLLLLFSISGCLLAQQSAAPASPNSAGVHPEAGELSSPASSRNKDGIDVSYKGCYASLKRGELIVGNNHVRRKWLVEGDQLVATSIFDLDGQVEWITGPIRGAPSIHSNSGLAVQSVLWSESGALAPVEEPSLRVHLRLESDGVAAATYTFQVFPEASGIRMRVSRLRDPNASAEQPVLYPIEEMATDKQHLRFIQVTLRDRTDEHNELVFENEWLLQPNEALLELQGNVFVIEDTLTGNGFVFLKEAPQPEMRPVKTAFDVRVAGSRTGLSKTSEGRRTFFGLSFFQAPASTDDEPYSTVILAYQGGRLGRTVGLQRYQRQVRAYQPGRDGQLLSNTWGDRSGDTKLSEAFIRAEIDAGKRLGVDIVQIDDGWEKGITMVRSKTGVWESYRTTDPAFWTINPARFPNGFLPLTQYAAGQGMKLGLWFAPDSAGNFSRWRQDADFLLDQNRTDNIAAFKLDSVKIRSKIGEANYHRLIDRVLKESNGKVLLDLDVTAETRQGYFGNIGAGTLFVENRYTDWHRYWPHQTLRNLWKLSQYVDPVRLRMEFLNPDRNRDLYSDDPLAPDKYDSSTLFATVMMSSPLGWFENSGLSTSFIKDASPLVAEWKKERDTIYRETRLPIGEAPDGTTWTGFASLSDDRNSGYLLVFRELNRAAHWTVPSGIFAPGVYDVHLLAGQGSVAASGESFDVTVPQPLGFVWARIEKRQ